MVKITFLSIDAETTGLNKYKDKIIELAFVHFEKGKKISEKTFLFNANQRLKPFITKITGITDELLRKKPVFESCVNELLYAISNVAFVVAYNASFDRGFLVMELNRIGVKLPNLLWIDPLVFVRHIDKYKKGKKLIDATKRRGIYLKKAHRALSDTIAVGLLLYSLEIKICAVTLNELNKEQQKLKVNQKKEYKKYKTRNIVF